MKKFKIFALILALLIAFGGCSSKNLSYDSVAESTENGYWADDNYYEIEQVSPESAEEKTAFDSVSSSSLSESEYSGNRKLIRTFDLDVETLEFDSFVASVKAEVNSIGGYIESSSVSGNSYNYSSRRYASFTCRVPSDRLDEFIGTVGGLGNVTYSNENAKDVTLSYVDTEARIESLQTEYDRLLELLAEAESIDSIIVLEQRITEVRYQLESYKSQLRTYDNLVDYSTVYLNVNEVKRITAAEQETVWERIQSDFSDNIYDIWVGLQDFFVWFVANIPYFVIWAVIIAIIVLIVKFFLRKSTRYQERKAARKAAKEYKKAQKLAKKNAENSPEEK